ncbi:Octopamine receptor beta-2R [Hondaea fermentalgiana]|uniref:Octopamine receptor beta-2R n=1 Tax=Hondaea fermentalgiana TaxID=2315210 RepID=A0A2R5GL97_9STRA|nr:Octopamine receptor beta-2R [Hondaea fermentalgiana]|eukprot:GBG29051.1 Octopamine receptor beta-2R [Hondaea fermentalgiana]
MEQNKRNVNASSAALASLVCAAGGDPSGDILQGFEGKLAAAALCDCSTAVVNVDLDWSLSSKPGNILYYVVLGILGISVVIANMAIIIGIARDRNIQQLHNLLVAGQALSDLPVGLLAAIFNLGSLFNNGQILGGEAGCAVYGFGIVATCQTTVFSLCLIAYSRKVRILDNAHVPMRRMLLLYCCGVWGGSMTLMGIYVLLTTARMSCSRAFCNPIWNVELIIVNGITLGLPIVYTVSVYYRIHCRLKETMRAVETTLCSRTGQDIYSRNKTTRLMILMSGSILVLWTPLYIFYLFSVYKLAVGRDPGGMQVMERLLGISAVGSSLASPIIYAFKNKTLKLAMQYSFLPQEWKLAAADRERARALVKQQRRNASQHQISSTDCSRVSDQDCTMRCPCTFKSHDLCKWLFGRSNFQGRLAAVTSDVRWSVSHEQSGKPPGLAQARGIFKRAPGEGRDPEGQFAAVDEAALEQVIARDREEHASFWEQGHFAPRATHLHANVCRRPSCSVDEEDHEHDASDSDVDVACKANLEDCAVSENTSMQLS